MGTVLLKLLVSCRKLGISGPEKYIAIAAKKLIVVGGWLLYA